MSVDGEQIGIKTLPDALALARDADHFVTVTDEQCDETVAVLGGHGMQTTPSGAAGVAGPHHAGVHREALGVSDDSRVLAFITEGPEDDT